MTCEAVPTYWTDRLLRFFAIRFRFVGAGSSTFPRLYRQGPDVILSASGYLTSRRMLLWLKITDLLVRIAKITLFTTTIVWLVPEWDIPHIDEAPTAMLSLALWIVLRTPLHRPLGKLMLGKKTVIEFRTKVVRIYRNGYGLSWPVTIRRNPQLDVSSDIDEHERRREEEIRLRNPETADERAAIVYENSFRVKLIHGSRVERVAEVHDEFDARRFSEAIKKAEELRHELIAQRIERRAHVDDLPE